MKTMRFTPLLCFLLQANCLLECIREHRPSISAPPPTEPGKEADVKNDHPHASLTSLFRAWKGKPGLLDNYLIFLLIRPKLPHELILSKFWCEHGVTFIYQPFSCFLKFPETCSCGAGNLSFSDCHLKFFCDIHTKVNHLKSLLIRPKMAAWGNFKQIVMKTRFMTVKKKS